LGDPLVPFSTLTITHLDRHKTSFIEMADILPFHAYITEETLIAATRLHNRLPPDTAFPQVDVLSDGFKELCAIIVKYNLHCYFRLRLLHRHITIPEGQILLGTSTTGLLGYWTRPTRISDIDLHKIHGHIFSVDATSCTSEGKMRNARLFPSEFREGPPVSVENIDPNFFTEFTNCLWKWRLENTLGLEVIHGQVGKMIEFSFDIGSLLLKEEEVREERTAQFTFQVTGWGITIKNGAVTQMGEIQCVKLGDEHRPIPVPDPDEVIKVSDIVKILRDQGIFVMQGI